MTTPYDTGRSAGTGNDWAAYTEAARRIAAIRRDEAHREARRASAVRDGEAELDRLRHRLAAQREQLTELSTLLRLPAPALDRAARSPVPDPAEALRRAAGAADRAERAARSAQRRAGQPALLPALTPPVRNAAVYTGTAVLGSLISAALYAASPTAGAARIPWQLAPWSLCGLPALAFFAGYALISALGRPRVGEAGTRSVRLGGAICLAGMPVLWLVIVAAMSG